MVSLRYKGRDGQVLLSVEEASERGSGWRFGDKRDEVEDRRFGDVIDLDLSTRRTAFGFELEHHAKNGRINFLTTQTWSLGPLVGGETSMYVREERQNSKCRTPTRGRFVGTNRPRVGVLHLRWGSVRLSEEGSKKSKKGVDNAERRIKRSSATMSLC